MGITWSSMFGNTADDENATDTSDEELDLKCLRGYSEDEKRIEMNSFPDNCLEMDAAVTPLRLGNPWVRSSGTNGGDFHAVAAELSQYEKISLIFLLNEECNDALSRMNRLLVEDSPECILPSDFRLDNNQDRNKLIEALCIIQNFYVLRKYFGQSKSDAIERYEPYQRRTSIYITETKKCLYSLFEDMTLKDQEAFLSTLRRNTPDLPYFPYMEMYFTYFETRDFIGQNDFVYIEKALIRIKKDVFYSDLVSINPNRAHVNRRINLDRHQSVTTEITDLSSTYKGDSKPLEAYPMDPAHPGIVVIINIANFYTDNELQDFANTTKIQDRQGSNYDAERLEQTFKRFNFKIINNPNLTHDEMLPFLRDVAHNDFKPEYSSLFVCLMSHGEVGKIYASNSISVEIEDIKKQLHSPNLVGKPKVLIIQCCQGKEMQTLTTDGVNSQEAEPTPPPDSRVIPKTTDFLEIWSTVPGYASIRDPNKGSWFIQNLCDIIESSGEGANMLDICIMTRNSLLKERWAVRNKDKIVEVRVMVCETRETLLKRLLLPQIVDK